ncbi:hypothetical protein B0H34DRAFT_396747 [Crassisporium funariophilum]|nr:hypothetical protein B0H34DRAFT_396747 [Crassisporium funariophilum]
MASSTRPRLPSRKEVLEGRNRIRVNCFLCARNDPEVKRCATCKAVWYCSRKCQKEDWSQHRLRCSALKEEHSDRTINSIGYICGNNLFHFYLEVCIALTFDLPNHPSLDRPFMACLIFGIEACNPQDTLKIMDRSAPIDATPMQGMLQMILLSPPFEGSDLVDRSYEAKFAQAREACDKEGGQECPVGFLGFIDLPGESQKTNSGILPFRVSQRALRMAREERWITMPAMSGGGSGMKKPMTAQSALEFINAHIRLDTHNKFHMRANMTQVDKETLLEFGGSLFGFSYSASLGIVGPSRLS